MRASMRSRTSTANEDAPTGPCTAVAQGVGVVAAFPAPRRYQRELLYHQRELPHHHLARQQEAAARLAALTMLTPLTPLPLSPALSQEERDEVLAVQNSGTCLLSCLSMSN
jgi:hypothetical protein